MDDEDRSLIKGLLGAPGPRSSDKRRLKAFEDLQGDPAVCGFGGSSDLSLNPLTPLSFSLSTTSTPVKDLQNGTKWSKVGASS